MTGSPLIGFDWIDDACLSATAEHTRRCEAVEPGLQYANSSQKQWIVWEKSDFASLCRIFEERCHRLDVGGPELDEDHGFISAQQISTASASVTQNVLSKGVDRLAEDDVSTLIALANLDPSNLQAVLVGGANAAILGWSDQALRVFESGIARFPSDVRLLVGYGLVLESVGRLDDAVSVFQKLQGMAPSDGYAAKLAEIERARGAAGGQQVTRQPGGK
jgi:tetratricopeptide (TPR) repeat protein